MFTNFENLDKAFENKVRLGIMSILMTEDQAGFNDLKESLQLTDGNLASHLKAFEKLGYISVIKSFVGRKPHTSYTATKLGIKAFKHHINTLERIIKAMK